MMLRLQKIHLSKDPLGKSKEGKKIYLKDIWPTNKEIEIYGISHAEFGKQGIVREFILIDEISIWKQLLL